MELNRIIDHTLLKPEATYQEIEKLCREAEEYGFAAVCVNPVHVRQAAKLLAKTGIEVCTVIGFPLGAELPLIKAIQVREAIANGATEVDMVMNIGALKSGDYELVFRDIKTVVDAAAGQALTKVIIETCLLTDEEKVKACLLAKEAGAGFVKTSTGFNKGGATAADVALMRKTVGTAMGVKAAGGIRDRRTAEEMVRAGANRLGTSSGVAISRDRGSGITVPCPSIGPRPSFQKWMKVLERTRGSAARRTGNRAGQGTVPALSRRGKHGVWPTFFSDCPGWRRRRRDAGCRPFWRRRQ